jgi:hypothetical protein
MANEFPAIRSHAGQAGFAEKRRGNAEIKGNSGLKIFLFVCDCRKFSSVRRPECGGYVLRAGRMTDETAAVRVETPQVRRYLADMKTTVSSRGQIVLPAELRQMDRVEPGQEFDFERLDRGDYRLIRRTPLRNEGAVDWLLACPQKGFFVPIDSESTDTL